MNYPQNTAKRIAKIIDREGWDGIVLDVESIKFGKGSASRLEKFVSEVKSALGDKIVSVATTPNFADRTNPNYKHHDFYNFGALAKVADYLQIMAYDFHKGVRGPVNILPNSKLPDIVEYATKRVEDKDQIVVLLPFYGAKWNRSGSRRPINVTSNMLKYIKRNKKINQQEYRDGELYVRCGKEHYLLQDEKVIEDRLKKIGDVNVGAWRTSFASPEMITTLAKDT